MRGMIKAIKDRVSILDVLEHFGVEVPARGGDPVMVCCPWHEDRNPSLAVYRQSNRAWCYGCNRGGDVLDVTAQFMGGSITQAVRYWKRRLNLGPSRAYEGKHEEKRIRRLARLAGLEKHEERRIQRLARLASLEVEKGLPLPRTEGELEVLEALYRRKDGIDYSLSFIQDMEDLKAYISSLKAWREEVIYTVLEERWRRVFEEGEDTSGIQA